MTTIWHAWVTEYPDEGGVEFDAPDKETAERVGAAYLNEEVERVSVRRGPLAKDDGSDAL
jgi:hypothetical protein